jgi:hypothetical protein
MTQPVHTPGPVKTHNPADGCKNDGLYWQILQSTKDAIGARAIIASDMSRDDCRLLAAAYNAFDSAAKKLGVNTVELAERMQDGEMAVLVECLKDVLSRFHSCIADGNGKIEGDQAAMARAGKILDRMKGGAHG